MPTRSVRCPHCNEALELDEDELATRVDCPRCKRGFCWNELEERKAIEQEQRAREAAAHVAKVKAWQKERASAHAAELARWHARAAKSSRQESVSAAPASDRSGNATAGMILGVLALIAWCLPVLGVPVSVIGLALSVQGLQSKGHGNAMAGLVLNVIGLVLSCANGVLGAYMGFMGRL